MKLLLFALIVIGNQTAEALSKCERAIMIIDFPSFQSEWTSEQFEKAVGRQILFQHFGSAEKADEIIAKRQTLRDIGSFGLSTQKIIREILADAVSEESYKLWFESSGGTERPFTVHAIQEKGGRPVVYSAVVNEKRNHK